MKCHLELQLRHHIPNELNNSIYLPNCAKTNCLSWGYKAIAIQWEIHVYTTTILASDNLGIGGIINDFVFFYLADIDFHLLSLVNK